MDYVALVRGIGPGNPKMANAAMVEALERAGLHDARAVISSGNYLFRSDERSGRRVEDAVETALSAHLGSTASAIVRSRRQIEGITKLRIFDGCDDGPTARCQVTFLKRRPPADHGLPDRGDGYEVLAIERQAVFFTVDSSRQKTPEVMSLMESTFGRGVTTRTWKTVHRIARAFKG